ncbi:MAG: hypothetical protein HYZ09_00135 [Candidatus Kerfeldbacteria bacterium]|nr:hypothetical protein [Candidatus Kerfeldbacteria bacterium]
MFAHLYRILPNASCYVGPFDAHESAKRWITAQGFTKEGTRFYHPQLRFWCTIHRQARTEGRIIDPAAWRSDEWSAGVQPLRIRIR